MSDPLFPGIQTHPDVMACGLSSMTPVVHPAGVLMNAGRIERSHGEFYFYEEGVTPAVARAIMAVDDERRAHLPAALRDAMQVQRSTARPEGRHDRDARRRGVDEMC